MSEHIRVRAPGRVNLIGEHTDYTGGLVFPIAIDRWTEVIGQRSDRLQVSSDDGEGDIDLALADCHDPGSIAGWGRYVAAVADEVGNGNGLAAHVTTTIPVGAGLSSSAALEMAIGLALGFDGSAQQLAELGRRAEHRATGVPTGIMDQLCIAAAKDAHATLIDCRSLAITHVPIPTDVDIVVRFIAHRTLQGSAYADRVHECATAEALIGPLRDATVADLTGIDDDVVRRRARHAITENLRVLDFAAALAAGDYSAAGEVMTRGHQSLRHDYETSTAVMDAAVAELTATPGVYGARMTGGGFGGCVVALCAPDADVTGWKVRPVDGAHHVLQAEQTEATHRLEH